jgi:hypothetical protein
MYPTMVLLFNAPAATVIAESVDDFHVVLAAYPVTASVEM